MEDLEYGPVEIVLAAYEGDHPDAGILEAIASLVDAGTVRIIDLVHVSRGDDGTVDFAEITDLSFAGGDFEPAASGLAADEDIVEMAQHMAPGTSAVLLVIELVWAKHLASRLAQANGAVLDFVRVPAPVVNAVVAEARAAVEAEG